MYGSHRGDFIPIEIGAVIFGSEDNTPILESKKFFYDLDLVIRRNIINDVAKTIGFSETVANIKWGQYQKLFDPKYRLKRSEKLATRKLFNKSLIALRKYLQGLLKQHQVTQIVVFGGREDLKLLRKANIDISKIEVIDIQSIIRKEICYLFSLDKISFIIGFYATTRFFGAKNLRYPLPERYKYLIKPHKAIGDACRIFVLYHEFHSMKLEFMLSCSEYLEAHEKIKRPQTLLTSHKDCSAV